MFDSQGRLIVADRHNHRIQILTKDGKYLGEYRGVQPRERHRDRRERHDLCGRFRIDAEEPSRLAQGIRIGSLKDGKVTMFVPPHQTERRMERWEKAIAIDAAGNLYTAEATVRGIYKYVRK